MPGARVQGSGDAGANCRWNLPGCLRGPQAGALFIDMTTADRQQIRPAAAIAAGRSIPYMDVAILGVIALTHAKTNPLGAGVGLALRRGRRTAQANCGPLGCRSRCRPGSRRYLQVYPPSWLESLSTRHRRPWARPSIGCSRRMASSDRRAINAAPSACCRSTISLT